MIVDDCITLIGSANINDRSLLGSRDSEVQFQVFFLSHAVKVWLDFKVLLLIHSHTLSYFMRPFNSFLSVVILIS